MMVSMSTTHTSDFDQAVRLARSIAGYVSNGWPASTDADKQYDRLDDLCADLTDAELVAIESILEA